MGGREGGGEGERNLHGGANGSPHDQTAAIIGCITSHIPAKLPNMAVPKLTDGI